jgi:phosphatidylinositol alpha-1,6-mannosyltransferase
LCRLSYQKGIDYVLRAMARMPAVGANAPLVYVSAGTGPHLENFQRLAAELGIGARVLFPGVVPYAETPVVMSAADIYVQPSQPYGVIVESFGISFVEAQAAGVPCIGTSFGGIPEAVDTDRSGLLVPVEDLESLVSALESLVSDPGLRKTMGEHGRAFARKHSRTRHMEQLRTLISEHARK